MDDKYLYEVNKINLYNISSCSKKLSFAEEQKICELAEIAESVSKFIRARPLGRGWSIFSTSW